MTLTTRVYVHDQISRSEVMDYCNRLLEAPKDVATRDEEMWLAEDGRRVMGNLPCQGLDGLLKVYYRANAFYEEEDRYEHDGEERWLSSPKCWIQVSIDSPYGYRGENGESCGGRHARFVFDLGRWLDLKGVRWSWKNEYTGEIWSGEDRYQRLMDLVDSGEKSRDWFRNTFIPALRRNGWAV